ncbi:uracil-xanthine permease family protein [Brochothrix campestris]|uniref:Uracil permease n=1 Tax=Brochothrix campestris FSL F6-1037 TaxID=1265861 RepID=W7CDE2_9LIST|nr:solute carrier family 23 protein [Brochothrix campestris]EUJ37349.1 hypothetical protein BCAMP_09970 [Brochothrix campestris FSL F6-1037]
MTVRKTVLDIHEKPTIPQWLILSIQHLFAMFGSTVLVPRLVGMDPGVALVSSGLGSLAYILITRGKIPAYLGSSFTFIASLQVIGSQFGHGGIMVGTLSVGIVYAIISLIVYKFGIGWMNRVLPPIVVGPVIMVIGLSLAPTAAGMAMNTSGGVENYSVQSLMIAGITLIVTIFTMMFFKGILSLIPILVGIIVGYIVSVCVGVVDFGPVANASLFSVPNFSFPFITDTPIFNPTVILLMAPLAFVTMAEHMGHQFVLNKITNRNFFEDPGLHKSLLGDGMASVIASFIGGPPVTSYGENLGVLAITRVYSIYVIAGAGIFAVLFGFIGYVSAFINSIPASVLGGVSFLLFGVIAANGMKILVDNKIDFDDNRNLVIASVILVIGIGGVMISFAGSDLKLEGMSLAAIVGILINLIIPQSNKEA